MTYVHGVVLLKGALIRVGLAHENDNRVGASEEGVARPLVCLP